MEKVTMNESKLREVGQEEAQQVQGGYLTYTLENVQISSYSFRAAGR